MKTRSLDTPPSFAPWTVGALLAVGVGAGAALSASMGAIGWLLGLTACAVIAAARITRRR